MVPGAPVFDFVTSQKSLARPHWPQWLQQTLRGQGLRLASAIDWLAGRWVPGTVGPQTAFYIGNGQLLRFSNDGEAGRDRGRPTGTGAGIGAVPSLRQILTPGQKSVALHPFQPQVFWLNLEKSASVSWWRTATASQESSGWTV